MASWDHDDLRNRADDCHHGESKYTCDICRKKYMSDIQSPNAVIEGESSLVTFGEFWHLAPGDHAFAGPFTTQQAAQEDARQYLQDVGGRYNVDKIIIVKTVARGENTVTVDTNFHVV